MERIPMLNKNSLEVINFVGLDNARTKLANKRKISFFKALTMLLSISFFVYMVVR